jgi:hypothetical protein
VPVVEPVEAVVGDAAAGLAVVFEVDGCDVAVVELPAEADVVVEAGAEVVLIELAAVPPSVSLLPLLPLQAAPLRARASPSAAAARRPETRRATEDVRMPAERTGARATGRAPPGGEVLVWNRDH